MTAASWCRSRTPRRSPTACIDLLANPTRRHAMRKRAYMLGREMIWPVVAQRYMESLREGACGPRRASRGKRSRAQTLEKRPYQLPPLKLDHLFRMSDHTGIFQHAIYNVPNLQEGYCTDDNARAFIFMVLLEELEQKSPTGSGSARGDVSGVPLVRVRSARNGGSAIS